MLGGRAEGKELREGSWCRPGAQKQRLQLPPGLVASSAFSAGSAAPHPFQKMRTQFLTIIMGREGGPPGASSATQKKNIPFLGIAII